MHNIYSDTRETVEAEAIDRSAAPSRESRSTRGGVIQQSYDELSGVVQEITLLASTLTKRLGPVLLPGESDTATGSPDSGSDKCDIALALDRQTLGLRYVHTLLTDVCNRLQL